MVNRNSVNGKSVNRKSFNPLIKMKKIYISPTSELENLCTSQLLVESVDDVTGEGPGYSGGGHGGGSSKGRDEELEELAAEQDGIWGQLW